MVDRSVKMIGIEMKNKMEKTFSIPNLPEGFSFRFYKGEDDIRGWSEITHDVTFFDSREKAASYFREEFLTRPGDEALARERCIFVLDREGNYAGTCSAWYAGVFPKLHWLGVQSRYQGCGLGKALIQMTMYLFQEHHIAPVWLDTQTTSHKAVGLYLCNGFYPLTVSRHEPDKTKAPSPDFTEAVQVLNGKMLERFYTMFQSTAAAE